MFGVPVFIVLLGLLYLFTTQKLPFFIRDVDALQDEIRGADIVEIFCDGKLNNRIIKKFEFQGHARPESKIAGELIILKNSRKYEWASLNIDFRCPIDVSDKNIMLSVKGRRGGEKIFLVLRDSRNRSYRSAEIFLTPAWSRKVIRLKDVDGVIDLGEIDHLRFECSYAGEPPANRNVTIETTFFLKDVMFSNHLDDLS